MGKASALDGPLLSHAEYHRRWTRTVVPFTVQLVDHAPSRRLRLDAAALSSAADDVRPYVADGTVRARDCDPRIGALL